MHSGVKVQNGNTYNYTYIYACIVILVYSCVYRAHSSCNEMGQHIHKYKYTPNKQKCKRWRKKKKPQRKITGKYHIGTGHKAQCIIFRRSSHWVASQPVLNNRNALYKMLINMIRVMHTCINIKHEWHYSSTQALFMLVYTLLIQSDTFTRHCTSAD